MRVLRLTVPTLVGVLVIGAAGCQMTAQTVRLDPPVKLQPGEDASGTVVGLAVIDIRGDQQLGTIEDATGTTFPVRTAEGSAAAINQRVSEALTRKGFKVKPLSDDDPASLVVELRELRYGSKKDRYDWGLSLGASVSAKAKNGLETYARTFNLAQEKGMGRPPTEKDSTYWVNEGVAQALDDMLNDAELLNMLRH